MEALFHAGALDFGAEELARLIALMRRVPTVVDIYLDRPAVIPELAEAAAALLADFGVSDAALLDVVFGRTTPTGVLPFELPSSMDAVRRQLPDVPYDSEDPLFPFGHGLSYGGAANRFGLSARPGPRPRTTPTNPHVQLDGNAPLELQELLFEKRGPSQVYESSRA